MSSKMTQKEYVKLGGIRCPFCKSDEVDSRSDIQTDLGVARQEVECQECHAIWTDLYDLVGYSSDEQ